MYLLKHKAENNLTIVSVRAMTKSCFPSLAFLYLCTLFHSSAYNHLITDSLQYIALLDLPFAEEIIMSNTPWI